LAGCSAKENTTNPPSKNISVTQKVEICLACHGADGKSGKLGVPALSGRSYEELAQAMERVRDTYSPEPLLGHSLTDEDIHDIATYFSSIK
jgi:cytochrome c553